MKIAPIGKNTKVYKNGLKRAGKSGFFWRKCPFLERNGMYFFPLSPGENEMENNNPKKCNAHTQSARKHTYALWAILKILQQMHSGSNRGCLPFCFIEIGATGALARHREFCDSDVIVIM